MNYEKFSNFMNRYSLPISMVATICTIILAICLIGTRIEKTGYRQGQIDAINGIVKYELVKQPDGSTAWKEKEEENDE